VDDAVVQRVRLRGGGGEVWPDAQPVVAGDTGRQGSGATRDEVLGALGGFTRR
jgi:hypothetical protein